jgi:hypothetical protein
MKKEEHKLFVGIAFFILACGLSWPLRLWKYFCQDQICELGISPLSLEVLSNWGPGIAAMVMYNFLGGSMPRSYSAFGKAFLRSLIFYLLPFAIWAMLLVVMPDEKITAQDYLLMIPLGFLIFLGQEMGWRGFCHDLLAQHPVWLKGLIIGVFWELWSFNEDVVSLDLKDAIFKKVTLFGLSIVIAIILEYGIKMTQSLAVVVTLHTWIHIQFKFPALSAQIAFVSSLVIWTLLILAWPSETRNKEYFNPLR